MEPAYTVAVIDPLPDLLTPPPEPLQDILEHEEFLIHVMPLATTASTPSAVDAVLVLTRQALYGVSPVSQGGFLRMLMTPQRPKVRTGFQQWRQDGVVDVTRISLEMIESVSILHGGDTSSTPSGHHLALCIFVSRNMVPQPQHFPPRDGSGVGKRDNSLSTTQTPLCFWLDDEAECRALQAAVRAACNNT